MTRMEKNLTHEQVEALSASDREVPVFLSFLEHNLLKAGMIIIHSMDTLDFERASMSFSGAKAVIAEMGEEKFTRFLNKMDANGCALDGTPMPEGEVEE